MPNEPHTLDAVLRRGELTEEEIYFVLRLAGHLGYDKAIERLEGPRALRHWLIWTGGWEPGLLSQWDQGRPTWEIFRNGRLQSPTPVSLFGHRITFHREWIDVRVAGGYLHIAPGKVYWSPNATPGHPEAIHFVGRRPRD